MKSLNTGGVITKRTLINKANTTTLIAAGAAAFLVVFSLVSAKSLISQLTYQNKVINEKKTTLKQIDTNLESVDDLKKSYKTFIDRPTNVIEGNAAGNADRDGNNAKIVLDALPSKYDFPALAASLEKLAVGKGLKISGITGTDEEVVQAAQQSNAKPTAQEMTIEVKVNGAYAQLQSLILDIERSIRPIQVQTMNIKVEDTGLTTNISSKTYYQPEKKLELTEKVIK